MNTVTQEMVDDAIVETDIRTLELVGKKHTIVAVKLYNGFTIVETTTCVDPKNYSEKIGAEVALGRIKNQIWHLLGFQLQDDLWLNEEIKS